MPSTTARTCPHCGRELRPRYIAAPFKVNGEEGKRVFMGFEECDCPGAERKREEEAKAEEERRRAEEREAYYRRLEGAGVPKRYLRAQHPLARELAAKVETGGSVYVWGPNGTLKTTLASAIVRQLVYHGKRCEMVNAVDLFIRVQSTYGTPEREEDVIARYSNRPFLVIDDLGKEQQTAWTASRLYAIVNARDANLRPTVITSNFPVSELADRMDGCDRSTAQAIASRLAGMCETVRTDGGDRRLS